MPHHAYLDNLTAVSWVIVVCLIIEFWLAIKDLIPSREHHDVIE
jgi:hypothetical protein